MRFGHVLLLALVGVAGCEEVPSQPEPEPPLARGDVERTWIFGWTDVGASSRSVALVREQTGGIVSDAYNHGPLAFLPAGTGPDATGEVYSDSSGSTFWASTEAPSTTLAGSAYASSVDLHQVIWFRKTAEDAVLQFLVTGVQLEAVDGNGGPPTALECPWLTDGASIEECRRAMWSTASFHIRGWAPEATDVTDGYSCGTSQCFFQAHGFAGLAGWSSDWKLEVYTLEGLEAVWDTTDFDFRADVDGNGGMHAQVRLRGPITIKVPVDRVELGGVFAVRATVFVDASNRRQRESYLSAYFRDPLSAEGLDVSYDGLEQVDVPTAALPDLTSRMEPAPSCTTAPGGLSGTVRFASATFLEPEMPIGYAPVLVTRTGGADGPVSVTLTTADGTAVTGSDYEAVEATILFADGEVGTRGVAIPIVSDTVPEPNKTLSLTLSDLQGCATLGTPSTATLTILDDDRPPPDAELFTIGGTVSGLEGAGLVVTNLSTESIDVGADGPFTFTRDLPDGALYDVRVATQPSGPDQVCSVNNGTGEIEGADVTDIEVSCVTPPPDDSGLDLGFGDAGRLWSDVIRTGASDIAIQADGKIVLVGGNKVVRYNPDGTVDGGFGTGGEVSVLVGDATDILTAVAIQPDGRIVVVGYADDPARITSQDVAVARLEANGILDGGFGSGGTIRLDVAGYGDRAQDVVIQDDGRIVVGGHGGRLGPQGVENDFMVVRFTSDGQVDPAFGAGGPRLTDVAGMDDLASAVLLQPDGNVLLVGRVAATAGDLPDIGVVRYTADGTPDASFGDAGTVQLVTDDVSEEAFDAALQPDGSIVVVGISRVQMLGAVTTFLIARLDPAGSLDPGFGGSGWVTHDISHLDDFARGVALQADGKIVVVGETSNQSNSNFGVDRYHSDGSLDTAFGTAGTRILDFFGGFDVAQAVAIQPDGKLVVAGSARNGTQTGVGLVRLLP